MKNVLTLLLLPIGLAGCPATLSDWSIASDESVTDAPDGQVDGPADAGSVPDSAADGLAVDSTPVMGDQVDADAGADDAPAPQDGAPAPDAASAPETGACTSVTHADGVGQSWQDCTPLGTYTAEQAIRACAAYTGDASKCEVATTCPDGTAVVDSGFTSYVWEYEGPLVGRVFEGQAGCSPMGGTSVWN